MCVQQLESQGLESGISSVFLDLFAKGGLPTFAFVSIQLLLHILHTLFRNQVRVTKSVLHRRKKERQRICYIFLKIHFCDFGRGFFWLFSSVGFMVAKLRTKYLKKKYASTSPEQLKTWPVHFALSLCEDAGDFSLQLTHSGSLIWNNKTDFNTCLGFAGKPWHIRKRTWVFFKDSTSPFTSISFALTKKRFITALVWILPEN